MVKLTNDGKFFIKEVENLSDVGVEYEATEAEQILANWYKPIYLDPGVTVRDLMGAVKNLKNYHLIGLLSENVWMEEFMEEAFYVEGDTSDVGLVELSFGWRGSFRSHWRTANQESRYDHPHAPIKKTKQRSLVIYPEVFGLGPVEPGYAYGSAPDQDGNIRYAIDFIPVNNLINLPIRLEQDFVIYDREGSSPKGTKTVREWKLGEFLRAFFYEISFMGGPAEREAEVEEIRSRLRELEEQRHRPDVQGQ